MVNAQIFGHLIHHIPFIHLAQQLLHGALHTFWQPIDVLGFDSNTYFVVLYGDEEVSQFTPGKGLYHLGPIGLGI